MSTIQNMSRRVQALARTYVPRKLHPRFLTGVEALSTKGLASLNANGRNLCDNRWTGEVRIRRTVTDERFPALLMKAILKEFVPKHGTLRLSLDHSTFGVFTVAVFALSAGKGRALPVWCVITRTGKGHPLLKPLLRGFRGPLGRLAYGQRKRLVVVMDRWFAIPDLLEYLDAEHIDFIVQLKKDTPLGVPWVEPYLTTTAGEVSLTNISVRRKSRQQILRCYAKRFEIEEHFKDVKWVEGYEWHRMRKLATTRTVFMFVFFGWWLLLKAYGTAAEHGSERKTHPKKQLSWFRTIWEYWLRLRQKPVFLTS